MGPSFLKKAVLAVVGLFLLLGAAYGVRLYLTIASTEQEGDIAAAEEVIATISSEHREAHTEELERVESTDTTTPFVEEEVEPYPLPETRNPHAISPPIDDDMFESILLIGADESGLRADAIILVLLAEGEDPIMASIPRDLYIENPCTNDYRKINSNLFGCGDSVSGPELLSVAVQRFTGVPIDHFALVDFEGFADAVDAVGGIDWCFEYAVYDEKAWLDEPAGCRTIDGDTALAWARSRKTQIYKDGQWQGIGASDFTRQEHQQELLFALLKKVASFGSIGSLQGVAEAAVANVTLSESLGIGQAVGMAWDHRNVRPSSIVTIGLQADPATTEAGLWVLEPTMSFNSLLASVYPAAYVPVEAFGSGD